MTAQAATRARAAIAIAAVCVPAFASAQTLGWRAGFSGRAEYSDNYFFTAEDEQSAFTLALTPSLAVGRTSEHGGVFGLLSVTGSNVSGPDIDDITGRAQLEGTLLQERSQLKGNAGFHRTRALQNVATPAGIVYALAYVNGAFANGIYSHAVSERTSIDARVSAYANRYDDVPGNDVAGPDAFVDNHGARAGVGARYQYSSQTYATVSVDYSHYSSDVERTDSASVVVGVVHRHAPQLTLSGSVGYYWADSSLPETSSKNGGLAGGEATYEVSERWRVALRGSMGLVPTGSGTLSRQANVAASTVYRIDERTLVRGGIGYLRDSLLTGLRESTEAFTAEVGIGYRLAERWTLDAGYRYTRARYVRDGTEPRANVAFVVVGYEWPDASYRSAALVRFETIVNPVAGPVPFPATPTIEPSRPSTGDPLDGSIVP